MSEGTGLVKAWQIVFTKQAQRDARRLASAGLRFHEAFALREALGLAYEARKELQTLDWVLRIKVVDAVISKDNFYNTLKRLLKIEDYDKAVPILLHLPRHNSIRQTTPR